MDSILSHYQEELTFLREQGRKFALQYPAIANKIDFNGNQSNDPQTERIIESFAFIVAHLNAKIESNAEDLAYYLLTGLYPGITSVFPPCSIVHFDSSSYNFLPRNSQLQVPITRDDTKQGEFSDSCIFKTIYPITIYPLKITKLSVTHDGDLKIDIKTLSVPVENMQLNELMFYIDASLIDNAIALYASLFTNVTNITLIINSQRYVLSNALKLCGFDEDETAVPVPKFVNYSFYLLREVFLFPQKFMFFKITGIDDIIQRYAIRDIDCFSICISLSNTEIKLNNNSIRINAVPVVNLFDYTTNSFRFDGTKLKYLLLSNANQHIAIHSIKDVHLIDSRSKEDNIIPQYFSFDYCSSNNSADTIFWFQPFDAENSTYISFIDSKVNPTNIYADVAYAKTLCINKLNQRNIRSDAIVRANGALSPDVFGKLILSPTEQFYVCKRDLWNLLNQLAFGQLSKSNIEQLSNKLQHIATLYSGVYSKTVQSMFDSIIKTNLRETNKRVIVDARSVFVKAYIYEITVKKEPLPNYSTLFFKVLERYLQNNKPINSCLEVKIVT